MFTRKAKRAFEFNFPGMFNTSHLNLTILGFVMIFVVEGFATVLAHSLAVNVIAIVIAIFVDVILAVLSHLFHSKIIINKNQQIFSDEGIRVKLKTQVSPLITYKNLFYLLILLSGVFKFWLFYIGYLSVDFICVGIFLCYIIGALLHISCTGYLLYTMYFAIKIHSEFQAYESSGMTRYIYDVNSPLRTIIDSEIHLNEAQRGEHKVKLLKYDDNRREYCFESCGIMNDSDLNFLISRQSSPAQRIIVAKFGVKHQFTNLNLGGLRLAQ